MWLLVVTVALVALSALWWFFSSRQKLILFDQIPNGPCIQRAPYWACLNNRFLGPNVLIISRPTDVALFAKHQGSTDRRMSFWSTMGVAWPAVGIDMLGCCDHNRHSTLLSVFRRALNAARLAAVKQEIACQVRQFLDVHVPFGQSFALTAGCFDELFVKVLSLVVVGSDGAPVDRLRVISARHRAFVQPLLGNPWTRLPLASLLFFYALSRVRVHMSDFSDWLESVTTASEGSAVDLGRRAVEAGQISRSEFVHTIYELLFFNVEIFEAEVRAILSYIHRIKEFEDLDVFMTECTRIHPSIQISFPEALTHDCDGLGVRGGTFVAVDVQAYNESKTRPFSPNPSRSPLYRFGLGPRSCIGQNIAKFVLREFISALQERGNVSLIEEKSTSKTGLAVVRLAPNAYLKISKHEG